MTRRDFLEVSGGTMVAAQPPVGERKTNYFLLQTYYLRNSTQAPRINEFMSQGLLPALNRVHSGPKIFLEGLVAAHMPQYAVIIGFPALEDVQALSGKMNADAELQKRFTVWEAGAEPPYEHYSQTLLKAADYCPELAPLPPAPKPRVFELRTYHSPTWRQLRALHRRFAGPEIRIFQRTGVHPIIYSETLFGPSMPNLTYLTPFAGLAEREKAWDAFGSDPEWVKVRRESIEADGQISSVMQIALYRATSYSPMR